MRKGIAASILFHVILLLWIFLSRKYSPQNGIMLEAKNTKPLQVRTISPEDMQKDLKDALEKGESQIVQSDDQIASKEAGQRKGRQFLTKHNQAVDAETRAARVGQFKNVLKEGIESPGDPKQPGTAAQKEQKKSEEPQANPQVAKLFELPRAERDKEPETALQKKTGRVTRSPASIPHEKGEGFSATDDYLKDIAIGANTLLNAKEYKFYGFYERIREKLSYQWHESLEQAFEKILAQHRNLAGQEELTQVEVRMDSNGQVDSVRIIGSSGVVELDTAATEAFRKASPFPNPPTEMLDSKKVLALRWDFVVVADENAGFQVKVRQSAWE